jgi:hypothetical protein
VSLLHIQGPQVAQRGHRRDRSCAALSFTSNLNDIDIDMIRPYLPMSGILAGGNGAFDGATRLLVAFTFGMGILVLAYAAGHHSGGQINCAVTLSLVLGGQVPWFQGLVIAIVLLPICSLCAVLLKKR